MKRKDREINEKRGEEICNQYNWNYGLVNKVNYLHYLKWNGQTERQKQL